jgi:hypothetical protein
MNIVFDIFLRNVVKYMLSILIAFFSKNCVFLYFVVWKS